MARQWQTVLLSMLLHAVALFFIVVIPLLAMDALPGLPGMTRYVPVEITVPPMPAAPQPAVAAIQATTSVGGPPLEAPMEIRPEAPERPALLANLPHVDSGIGVPGTGNRLSSDATNVTLPRPADPVHPGGNVKAPMRLIYAPPVYPSIAIAARVAGTVVIEAVISTDGSVRDARVLRSIPLLDEAALAAVRQWRYSPTTLNGVPVAVIMTVTVTFQLGGTD